MIKANIDDKYKLIQMSIQEYQNIIAEYKETWHTYRVGSESQNNLRYNRAILEFINNNKRNCFINFFLSLLFSLFLSQRLCMRNFHWQKPEMRPRSICRNSK